VNPDASRPHYLPLALSYLAVYVIWGSTYFFIRMAVETISPYLIVGVRFSLGGLVLLAAALAGGRLKEGLDWRRILSACLLGALLLFGANGLVTVAEQTVDSYLVALLLASVPLAVALFDRVLFGRRISALRLGGVLLGVAGVGVLLYRGAATLSVHTVLVLASIVLWAFATSLSHRLPLYADSLANAAIEMLCAGALSLAVFAVSGRPILPELLAASPRSHPHREPQPGQPGHRHAAGAGARRGDRRAAPGRGPAHGDRGTGGDALRRCAAGQDQEMTCTSQPIIRPKAVTVSSGAP
jgi:drug/metabolite transporter (DMT)-like permease